MQTPTIGSYALSFVLAGVGGWALSETLQHDAQPVPTTAVAPAAMTITVNTPGQGQGAQVVTQTGQTRRVGQSGGVAWPAPSSQQVAQRTVASGRRLAPARSGAAPARHLGARRPARAADSSLTQLLVVPASGIQGSGNIVAGNGAIVYVGNDGHLVANTGATSTSGVVALGVNGSDLGSGTSHGSVSSAPAAGQGGQGGQGGPAVSTGNGSLASMAGGGHGSVAVSGFEDHSVSVVGDDQVTTYDDSNVFLNRDGRINANTGDTDSSGLNVVDVTGSRVRSGNSGDGEGVEDDDADDAPVPMTPAPVAGQTSVSSDDEDGDSGDDSGARLSAAAPAVGAGRSRAAASSASVADEGDSTATGSSSMVIGADGYDDVAIRTHGDRDITTYDDSNVVIGGHGDVNAQIGDSDTGGAVVMGVHGSDVEAGCEGDLCYPSGR